MLSVRPLVFLHKVGQLQSDGYAGSNSLVNPCPLAGVKATFDLKNSDGHWNFPAFTRHVSRVTGRRLT